MKTPSYMKLQATELENYWMKRILAQFWRRQRQKFREGKLNSAKHIIPPLCHFSHRKKLCRPLFTSFLSPLKGSTTSWEGSRRGNGGAVGSAKGEKWGNAEVSVGETAASSACVRLQFSDGARDEVEPMGADQEGSADEWKCQSQVSGRVGGQAKGDYISKGCT